MMAKRVDTNQTAIVNALRECGLHIVHLHTVGKGVPDLLVTGYRRQTGHVEALLVEVKTAKGKVRQEQVAWHSEYPEGGPLLVARSAEEVLAWFGMV